MVYNEIYSLNINEMKWTFHHPQGDLPCPRYGHNGGIYKSNMYIFGG